MLSLFDFIEDKISFPFFIKSELSGEGIKSCSCISCIVNQIIYISFTGKK